MESHPGGMWPPLPNLRLAQMHLDSRLLFKDLTQKLVDGGHPLGVTDNVNVVKMCEQKFMCHQRMLLLLQCTMLSQRAQRASGHFLAHAVPGELHGCPRNLRAKSSASNTNHSTGAAFNMSSRMGHANREDASQCCAVLLAFPNSLEPPLHLQESGMQSTILPFEPEPQPALPCSPDHHDWRVYVWNMLVLHTPRKPEQQSGNIKKSFHPRDIRMFMLCARPSSISARANRISERHAPLVKPGTAFMTQARWLKTVSKSTDANHSKLAERLSK